MMENVMRVKVNGESRGWLSNEGGRHGVCGRSLSIRET